MFKERKLEATGPGQFRMTLEFELDRGQLSVEPAGPWTRLTLKDGHERGTPGEPAIPCLLTHIAIPDGARVTGLQVQGIKQHALDGVHRILPVQVRRRGDLKLSPTELKDRFDAAVPAGSVKRLAPVYAPPDMTLYKQSTPYPAAVTEGLKLRQIGPYQLLPVRVNPVSYVPAKGQLIVTERFTLVLSMVAGIPAQPLPEADGHQLEAWRALVKKLVLNPQDVRKFPLPAGAEPGCYLILTRAAMKAEFEQLAQWKRAIGWNARVVTVEEIQNGLHGDFSTCAGVPTRDLSEMIRTFLKWARPAWHVTHLLIGGDVEAVPMREIAGMSNYNWQTREPDQAATRPTSGHWLLSGTSALVHLQEAIPTGTPVLGMASFRPVPHNPQASNNAGQQGWYHTDSTYTHLSPHPTEYIVVKGACQDTTGYYFLTQSFMIPTDLYYSSLVSPLYDQPGKHDWDLLNIDPGSGKHLYGYHNDRDNASGIDFVPSIHCGRVPVATLAEARGAISKLLKYERYEGVRSSAMKRAIVAADYLFYPASVRPAPAGAATPGDNQFLIQYGRTFIQLDQVPTYEFNLIAEDDAQNWRLVPYARPVPNGGGGWCFAAGPMPSTTASEQGGQPVATRYILVWGAYGQRQPATYWVDPRSATDTVGQQEAVRRIWRERAPEVSEHVRVYRDHWSAPTPAPGEQVADYFLNSGNINAAFSEGAALASLTSHGDPGGCCWLGANAAPTLTNGANLPVVWAESCLTCDFRANDSLGEAMVLSPGGGAIAYVGYTVESWVGYGEVLERNFWHALLETPSVAGTLGTAMDARIGFLSHDNGGVKTKWTVAAIHLAGDPALRPWLAPPHRFQMTLHAAEAGQPAHVLVTDKKGRPVEGVLITSMRGGTVQFSGHTDASGRCIIKLYRPLLQPLTSSWVVTASKPGHVPVQQRESRRLEVLVP